MTKFLVTVLCAAHLKVCPIPNGYKSEFPAKDKESCLHRARNVIASFGYKTVDFKVDCEKQ